MSLQQAAKHLERHGRNGDDMLVHMSRGEVKSLNDIAMAHGGQLTINPQTGLPEAGFLKSLLPMIAGAGLMMVPGMQPIAAAALVGGGTAVATGDIKKGLMAGLGAYGGAGIGSALATSGAAATQAATPAVSLAEGAAAATPPAPIPQTPLTNSITPTIPDAAQSVVVKPNLANNYGYAPQPGPNIMTGNMPIPANSPMVGVRTTGNQMFEGIKSLGTEGGPTRFYENLGNVKGTFGPKTTLAAAAAPTLASAMEPEKQEETKTDSDPGQQYTYAANPANPFPEPDPYGRERRYFSPAYTARAAAGGMMASGGVSHLGDYSDGGRLLRGPGDGVSDSIPAVIGKKQPARLADGEFVIPARIVSELGNGSTEAGARKLYAMMDRIQKARGKTVGKGKVAKNSRSEKYLPA
jgi:hypothetical protein